MANQSSKYSKFLAGAASAALVATAIVPTALAAEVETAATDFSDVAPTHTHYDAIMQAVERGLFDGYTDGTFKPENSIDRKGVVKSLAKYVVSQSEYKTFEAYVAANKLAETVAPFNDVPATHGDKELFNASLIVKDSGIFRGSNNNLMPANNITRQQMAQVLVNGFGLKDLADVESTVTDNEKAQAQYVNYINILSENGVTAVTSFNPTSDVKRGQMASFLNRSFDVAHPEVNPTPEVVSVSAVNGTTIEVKFNKAIDAKTLKNATPSDVISLVASEGANNDVTVSQELSTDGKTLTLTAATSYFKGEYTVMVPFEVVKSVDGKYVSPVNQKVSVDDKVAPVLASAKATVKSTSDKVTSVTLTFEEAVKSIEVVKIAGVNHTTVVSGKTATISGLSLDATKAHEVTVVNAKDAAGNTKDVQSGQLNISVDNVAPSITSVVATGENTVKVTLDKALKDNNLEISGKVGSFTADVIESANVSEDNSKEYTLTLKRDYLSKSGSSDVVTLTVAKEKLVDVLGNSNSAEITKTVTVSKDTVAPAVTKVDTTVTNGKVTAFTVNFAEEVKSLDDSKVYVVNSKGEILNLSTVAVPTIDKDNKKVVFTLAAGIKADTYSFDLLAGFVTDKSFAGNQNAKYSFSVNVADVTQPVETAFTITEATEEDNVVIVNFGQSVKATGTGSALNPLAYSVNGVALPADAKVEFGKTDGVLDQSKVIITLPAGFVKANDTAAVFRVTEVQTFDNKVSKPFIKTINITDNTAPEALSFVATELGEITVTYSEAILLADSATISDEIALTDSKGDKITITGKAVKGGKLVLTVADASAVSKLSTVASATIDVKDAAENPQKAGLTVNK